MASEELIPREEGIGVNLGEPASAAGRSSFMNDLSNATSMVDDPYAPLGFSDIIEDAFREENIVFSTFSEINKQRLFTLYKPVKGYNALRDPRVQGRTELYQDLYASRSPGETGEILARIAEAEQRQRTFAAATPAARFGALTLAGTLNPDVLLPIGYAGSGFVRMAKAASFALAASTAQEIGLHQVNPRRTFDESLLSVAAITGVSATLARIAGPRGIGATHSADPFKGATRAAGERSERGLAEEGEDIAAASSAQSGERYDRSTVGAAQPSKANAIFDDLKQEGLVETGIGVERLPMNAKTRLLNSSSLAARSTVEDLVDLGGVIKRKNLDGPGGAEATMRSVETDYRITYLKDLFDSIDFQNTKFLEMRGSVPETVTGRVFKAQATRLTDRFGASEASMSLKEFRQQVGIAMKNADQHSVPQVAEAAKSWRKIVERLGKDADEAGLFERALKHEINTLKKEIDDLSRTPTRAQMARMAKLKKKLENLYKYGPDIGNALSFFPRHYRVDKIMADPERFIARVVDGMIDADPTVNLAAARKSAREIQRQILSYRPGVDIEKFGAGDASSARARMLDIRDEFLEEFVENDVEIVLRNYHKTIGTDIFLQKKFGDISMADTFETIGKEFDELIEAAPHPDEARILEIEKDRTLNDMRNLRDMVRGTFGASSDPFAPTTKFLKAMKTFNVLTMMGGATISSFVDLARPAMTEGLVAGYGPILKAFMGPNGAAIRSMAKAELQAAGEGLDIILGLRAMQLTDIGSPFGVMSQFERHMQEGANIFFHLNGLNMWNTAIKEWVSIPIAHRIVSDSIKWADGKLGKADIAKLTRHNIDEATAKVIAEEVRRVGVQENGVWMPNTAAWKNANEAVAAFRAALSQDVNRTIVTPGAGDKATWTSTEFGTVIAQFKSFGQAMVGRGIVSGMQEKTANFYVGMGLMVGMGYMVNEIKDALKGKERRRESLYDTFARALDRSGALGSFGDINMAIEILSNQKLGIGPRGQPGSSGGEVAGVLLGPSGSNLSRGLSAAGDIATLDINRYTAKDIARLVPGNNLPYVEPFRETLLRELE
jgi:hypothetical protein